MNLSHEHNDQAETLRNLRDRLNESAPRAVKDGPAARVYSVTSGKGGVGKTSVVSNVALSLARQGKRVLVIDADLGLANIDVVFGLTPRFNLNHFFSGEKTLDGIMVEGPEGIKILPAGSGVQKFTHLDAQDKRRFIEALDVLHGDFDSVLIDTEAGISENVTYFNVAAQDIMVVTTPDPTAITDAYALMKLLSTQYHQKRFYLIVNMVKDSDEGLDVYQKLTMVSNRFLDISIDYLGCIPFDKRMREAIRRQKAMVELYQGAKTSGAFETLARGMNNAPTVQQPKGTLQFFWQQYLAMNQGGEP